MPDVAAEAARRNIDLVAVPTEQACRLIAGLKKREVRAVLHVTCLPGDLGREPVVSSPLWMCCWII
jgi:hypothetical protein